MFTYNGTHANTYGLKVVTVDRSPLPAVENTLLEMASRNGAYFVRNKLKPREIELNVIVVGTNEDDLRSKTRNIGAWLYTQTPQPLIFDDEPTMQYLAVVDSTTLDEVLRIGEGTLKFIVPKGYAEAITPKFTALNDNGTTTVTNAGNHFTHPKIYATVQQAITTISFERYNTVGLPTINFANKVFGSYAENPHYTATNSSATSADNSALLLPTSATWRELQNMDALDSLNGISATPAVSTAGHMAQHIFTFDLIEAVERAYGAIPSTTVEGKVAWVKENIAEVIFKWWGYGSSPTGNKATLAFWESTGWATQYAVNHTLGTVTNLTRNFTQMTNRVTANGLIHFVVNAEPADATVQSKLYTDFATLDITVKKTREVLTLKGTFAVNDRVVIDNEKGYATLNGTNAMPMLSLGSKFLTLQKGNNGLVQSLGTKSTVEHKDRWL